MRDYDVWVVCCVLLLLYGWVGGMVQCIDVVCVVLHCYVDVVVCYVVVVVCCNGALLC
jgi:hypothetical protein